ncbi:Kelch-type beta propeller [Kalmanozyma brasiliensis GHG001]|uniref:Kelch-type beta propeller n=1 Tax=Kalmanozyma brasiliensis (strain GHG001) TaxID=1365824 RepID=UPI0028681686|nr:Kelch-type beta propeller [Kalmanozyma brasiliensis GHG001]EST10176.2 Kelch-type beta propeller [Kalmanozyma brasiliensis GHG001]
MHPSIANLSSRLHLCSGQVPPPLVGASATLVEPSHHVSAQGGAKVYLFGGRLVTSRRMVNTLYILDLDEMRWSRLTPTTKPSLGQTEASSEQPRPRYFHSADLWQDKIVFFGGMGYSQGQPDPHTGEPAEELCVLGELLAFDLSTQQWDYTLDFASRRPATDNDPSTSIQSETLQPAPRYAHLSSLSGDTLSIIGGQNLANQYVESINLFSLSENKWIGAQRFRKQCGSYRSLAVGSKYLHKDGQKAKCYPRAKDPLNGTDATASTPLASAHTTMPHADVVTQDIGQSSDKVEQNPLPMSSQAEPHQPLPVYLYSNFNFTNVKRELEVLTVRGEGDTATGSETGVPQQRARSHSNASQDSAIDADGPLSSLQAASQSLSGPFVSMEDRSSHMGGVTLPPGLRFPTGALLGPYLLISGTYLANATQSFSIWALHLPTMAWSRIESGSALSTGSWNRAILWPGKNRLVVVGHKERDLVSDYNHRQTNWDHVVVLELEAWGIYQPPQSVLSEAAVQLGLDKLAATAPSAMASAQALARGNGLTASSADAQNTPDQGLDQLHLGGRGDFEIVCSDGLRIGCDRAILEARWPWFKSKMDEFRKKARRTLRTAYPAAQDHQTGLRVIPEDIAEFLAEEDDDDDEAVDPLMVPASARDDPQTDKQKLRDPRFQPRHLQISEPSPVVLALLQFVYTLRICTALQRHPAVVCALMVLARTYNMDDLASWARHAAHVALADDLNPKASSSSGRHGDPLSPSSSNPHAFDPSESGGLDLFRPAESLGLHPDERHRLAVCLYEAASLCGCEGLQIRALRVVMAIARWLQKHGAAPGAGGGSGTGPERQGQGRGDGSSRDRSGSTSHFGPGSNGAGSASSASSQYRAGSISSYRAVMGGIFAAGPSPLLPMPSPVPSMSRAGSDTASSHGPLTPTSVYQSSLHRRGDSFSSSTDASHTGSAHAIASDGDSLDETSRPELRTLPPTQGFPSSRMEKFSFAAMTPDLSSRINGMAPGTMVLNLDAMDASIPPSIRKRYGLLDRTSSLSAGTVSEIAQAGSSSDPIDVVDETVRATKEVPRGTTLLDRRASESTNGKASSSQLLSSDDWSKRFHLPRHSIASHGTASPALSSPALTMDPSRSHLQASTASSPASEQFPVNSYGARSEREQVSRSGSQHSLSTDTSPAANSLDRIESGVPESHVSTPLAGIVISKDVSHLSPKEIAKLEKEERKRMEKEEKERKKAEKAEYKRLAAEAVFGPKGSSGPTPAPTSSDFAEYTAGTQASASDQGARGSPSRRSSDARSGTSTASPRTGSSLKTACSPRHPVPPAPVKRGEWAVTTATGGGPWFSAPPPFIVAPAGLRAVSKGNRSSNSLSGRSSTKTRLTS